MDTPPPSPTFFSYLRRSSVVEANPPPSLTSASPTPRKASTWDTPAASSVAPTASDISSRRASENHDASSASPLGYPNADSITTRNASAWDDEGTVPLSRTQASVSDITVRRATTLDRPPPGHEDSTWGWMSKIISNISGSVSDITVRRATALDRPPPGHEDSTWGWMSEIISIISGTTSGDEPRFMILGLCIIFGILEGSTSRKLTTKNVETFTRLWTVTNSEGAEELIARVIHDQNDNCWALYNMLYRRNSFGKQRIQIFDTSGQQNLSLFFSLMDQDEDGFLSSADLSSFAAIFGQDPPDEAIDRVTRKLDLDGDGKISLEDFRGAMAPIFDGMTWEFWLVAILLTLQL